MAELPEPVRRFLANIATLEELDLIVFLARHAGRPFTVALLSAELGIEPARLDRQLARLRRRNLVTLNDGAEPSWVYAPATTELAESVRRVLEAHGTHRSEVVQFVATRNVSELRAFAAAFRLRKDED